MRDSPHKSAHGLTRRYCELRSALKQRWRPGPCLLARAQFTAAASTYSMPHAMRPCVCSHLRSWACTVTDRSSYTHVFAVTLAAQRLLLASFQRDQRGGTQGPLHARRRHARCVARVVARRSRGLQCAGTGRWPWPDDIVHATCAAKQPAFQRRARPHVRPSD